MLGDDELIQRLRAGDESAAQELCDRHFAPLVRMAQRRLSAKLGRRLDAEDVVQSALLSFFGRVQDGGYAEMVDTGHLWKLLVVITLNKLRGQVERHTAAKRKMDHEQSVQFGIDNVFMESLTRQATPETAAMIVDEVEALTKDLEPSQRKIVQLRLQGFEHAEIAREVSRSERTVRRIMDKVKDRLERRMEDSWE